MKSKQSIIQLQDGEYLWDGKKLELILRPQ